MAPLIAAVLDLPGPDDGPYDAANSDAIPSAWREVLLSRYTDGAVCAGLFTACRVGKVWALTNACQLTVRLPLPSDQQSDNQAQSQAWQTQLATVQEALQVRGQQPARLVLECQDCAGTSAALLQVADALQGLGAGVTELQVKPNDASADTADSTGITAFLARAAPSLPSLVSLQLDECHGTLPPRDQLPSLRRLALRVIKSSRMAQSGSQTASIVNELASIQPYLVQITHLTITALGPIPWAVLFTPLTTSATHSTTPTVTPTTPPVATYPLTNFTTNKQLTNDLITPLLTHAPALTDLSVDGIHATISDHRGRQWGVQRLSSRLGMDLYHMARLPVCEGGKVLDVCIDDAYSSSLVVDDLTGLDEDIVVRLPEWRIHSKHMWVSHYDLFEPDQEPDILRNLMQQLQSLQAPGCLIELGDWHWSPENLDILRAALPSLTHLHIGIHTDTLTNQILSGCLALGTELRSLSVFTLELWPDASQPTHSTQGSAHNTTPQSHGPGPHTTQALTHSTQAHTHDAPHQPHSSQGQARTTQGPADTTHDTEPHSTHVPPGPSQPHSTQGQTYSAQGQSSNTQGPADTTQGHVQGQPVPSQPCSTHVPPGPAHTHGTQSEPRTATASTRPQPGTAQTTQEQPGPSQSQTTQGPADTTQGHTHSTQAPPHTTPGPADTTQGHTHITQAPTHSTPWPWEALSIESVDLPMLTNLPDPATANKRPVIRFRELDFGGVDEANAQQVKSWLQHVSFTPLKGTKHCTAHLASSHCPTLITQIALLRSATLTQPEPHMTVYIASPITHDTMQALTALPTWPTCAIDLTKSTWRLAPTEYVRLAQFVPGGYTEWRLSTQTDAAVQESVRRGLVEYRASMGLPVIRLVVQGLGSQKDQVYEAP